MTVAGDNLDQPCVGRRRLRHRLLYPASRWPCRYTRIAPFWHPWHLGAALARLRMRYLVWRGY